MKPNRAISRLNKARKGSIEAANEGHPGEDRWPAPPVWTVSSTSLAPEPWDDDAGCVLITSAPGTTPITSFVSHHDYLRGVGLLSPFSSELEVQRASITCPRSTAGTSHRPGLNLQFRTGRQPGERQGCGALSVVLKGELGFWAMSLLEVTAESPFANSH